MKKILMVLIALVSFVASANEYQLMGEYRSRAGDSLQFNYTDFKRFPIGLNIEFIEDTEFDYLRNVSLILSIAQYNQIFNTSLQAETTISLSESRELVVSKINDEIKILIKEYTNEKRAKIGATQTLSLKIKDNKIVSMNIVATKMRTGILFSYGQKEAYQSSAELEKIKNGLEYNRERLISKDDFAIFN